MRNRRIQKMKMTVSFNKAKDSNSEGCSSWNPDAEEDDDELDEQLIESDFENFEEGDALAPVNGLPTNPELVRRLINGRKFPFFRAVMLDTLIDGWVIRKDTFGEFVFEVRPAADV